MNKTIAYCKPNLVVLGRVAEMIYATRIRDSDRSHQAIQRHIQPAYDLDE